MICKTQKIIFVHIPKTAGQSIEKAIITNIGLSHEDRGKFLLRFNNEKDLGPKRLAHLFLSKYKDLEYISSQNFLEYFKFTIVRNPYSRLVSELNYRNASIQPVEEYIKSIPKHHYKDKWRHICPQTFYIYNGKSLNTEINKVYYFEKLQEAFDDLKGRFFRADIHLSHENSSSNKSWVKEKLTRDDLDYINDYYDLDFKMLGYKKL